jgi:excinuclease ABC subunit A
MTIEEALRKSGEILEEIEVVVDRLFLRKKDPDSERILDSIETAFRLGKGFLAVSFDNRQDFCFSRDFVCPDCLFKIPEMTPRHFSFNSPEGACEECSGLGVVREFDEQLLAPNRNLSIAEGAIIPLNKSARGDFLGNGTMGELASLAKRWGFSVHLPMRKISQKNLRKIFYGEEKEGGFPGVVAVFKRKYQEVTGSASRNDLERYMNLKTCPKCRGKRIKGAYLSAKVSGRSIDDIVNMDIRGFLAFLAELSNFDFGKKKKTILDPLVREMREKALSLMNVGLEYLSLSRGADSLSGGEGQRIRLATQIGADLSRIIYVLDEPSIGLHPRDTKKLILTMRDLQSFGNSLIVVEHDRDIILAADWVIDAGIE